MKNSDSIKKLAAALKIERVSRGLSQQALADQAGLSRLSISRIETGHSCDLDSFLSVLKALEMMDAFMAVFAPPIDPIAIAARAKSDKKPQRVRGKQNEKKIEKAPRQDPAKRVAERKVIWEEDK